jgi:hypothetical protein
MQKAANTVELVPVYDYNAGAAGDTMKAKAFASYTGTIAAAGGNLHVAPVASVNADVEGTYTAQDADGYFGIIKGNLFKFEATADGKMTAIEVGGVDTGTAATSNDGKYVGHFNHGAAGTAGDSKLYKNLAYISVNSGAARIAWMDGETKIMVNDGTDDQNIKCYTLSDLPGDVAIAASSEIDWADTDNDGRAEYVYVTGSIEGTTTYGLFYYNGGAAQWNGVDKKGTMFGWLNGEPTTVTFDDEDEFNAVKNSQGYKGHLFALQLTGGVVSNVMSSGAVNQPYVLYDYANSDNYDAKDLKAADWANVKTEPYATGTAFGLGSVNSKFGNPYTATTEAIYYNDMEEPAGGATTAGESQITYDASRRSISVNGVETYFLTPNSKVVGLGMSVNQESAILDYLNKSVHNDVTIVYEQNAVKSIVEIYVATDPNVTPGGEVTVEAGKPGLGVTNLGGTVSTGTTDAALTAIIKGVGPNNVVYSPNAKTTAAGVSNANEFLYFPFVGSASETSGATLTIYKNGVPVFQEAEPASVVGAKYFVINFVSGTSSNTTIGNVLEVGTYTYTIVGQATGTPLSSGSFVMN